MTISANKIPIVIPTMEFVSRLAKNTIAQMLHPLRMIIRMLLFILSFKVYPLAWHARNYYSYFVECKMNNRPIPLATPRAITIFQPTIWTSSAPLGEIDIMGHKSNSTYFTDFDVARSYHMCSLFRTGFKTWGEKCSFVNRPRSKEDGSGPFSLALAGVGCTFHKAIRPGQEYKIYTRVLSWDEKWLHLISHFVDNGADSVSFDQRHHDSENFEKYGESQDVENGIDSQSAVLATGMAKIVFKQGRRTIPPSEFLRDCGLLPQQEGDSAHQSMCKEAANEDERLTKIREAIEKRRARGHLVANHINGLHDGRSFYNINEIAFSSKA